METKYAYHANNTTECFCLFKWIDFYAKACNNITRRYLTEIPTDDSFKELKRSDSYSELNLGIASGDILSVESMLFRKSLVYDFDITSVKSVAGALKKGRKELVIRETLSNYTKLFDDLSCDPSSIGLKLNFYVMRLKSDTFLVEGLLRDFIKRCRLHMKMLAKTNRSVYYMAQSRLLLDEIAKFNSKQARVFKHIDDAILRYRSSSDGEFHLLEREIYSLRDKVTFKELMNKLNKSLGLLEVELQNGVSGSVDVRAEAENSANSALAPPYLSLRVSPFFLSEPSLSSHPWYDSDWVILVACGVIVLGAAYFLTKKDKDDGNDGGPGSISSSGIIPSKGLLDLLPPKKEGGCSFWDWILDICMNVRMNVRLMSVRFMDGPFAERQAKFRD